MTVFRTLAAWLKYHAYAEHANDPLRVPEAIATNRYAFAAKDFDATSPPHHPERGRIFV